MNSWFQTLCTRPAKQAGERYPASKLLKTCLWSTVCWNNTQAALKRRSTQSVHIRRNKKIGPTVALLNRCSRFEFLLLRSTYMKERSAGWLESWICQTRRARRCFHNNMFSLLGRRLNSTFWFSDNFQFLHQSETE